MGMRSRIGIFPLSMLALAFIVAGVVVFLLANASVGPEAAVLEWLADGPLLGSTMNLGCEPSLWRRTPERRYTYEDPSDVQSWLEEGREIGDIECILISLLESEEHEGEWPRVVFALGFIGKPETAEGLLPLLSDRSAFIRCVTIDSLQRLGCPTSRTAEMVAQVLREDDSPNVRLSAAFALAAWGGDKAAAALEGAMTDADELVAAAAAQGLVNMNESSCDP